MNLTLKLFYLISLFYFFSLLVFFQTSSVHASANSLQRDWILQMKQQPRGPFQRIRWFCKDGVVLPPKPYACRSHGGGVQHGEWTKKVKVLRKNNYLIANVLADLKTNSFDKTTRNLDILKSIVLENYLISVDDGWIFHKARFYRGALQVENEMKQAKKMLQVLWGNSSWWKHRFLLLREAGKIIPHGQAEGLIDDVRAQATKLSKADPDFLFLRNKIHGRPEASDARRVRSYAASKGKERLIRKYEYLASSIDKIYKRKLLLKTLETLSHQVRSNKRLSKWLKSVAGYLKSKPDPSIRMLISSEVIAKFRQEMKYFGSGKNLLSVVDATTVLEEDVFTAATSLLEKLPNTSRETRLTWLYNSSNALYGVGFISYRQLNAVRNTLKQLQKPNQKLSSYKAKLDYLSRVSQWADQRLRFHLNELTNHWGSIEPLVQRYYDDRLRGSPLLFYSTVLDSLVKDAYQIAGIQQEFFGKKMGAGLRALNPGLARGTLHILKTSHPKSSDFSKDGIYVLPTTIPELPPVAGIITAGEGSSLSHVQLLARNLGIPNVVINEKTLKRIRAYDGKRVFMAVSPGGVVKLALDSSLYNDVFGKKSQVQEFLIKPDLNKLDLSIKQPISIRKLSKNDSGRISGPKGANLAELKSIFPKTVTEGIVIPFGVFRSILDQPMPNEGKSVFEWMKAQYSIIQSMPSDSDMQKRFVRIFLLRLQRWIEKAVPDLKFIQSLRQKMRQVFGEDKSFGVFVRSDTNVEDLPGFTGAGLNKTVPHVVGFDNIIKAIGKVWASPFSERAYSWRQAHMKNPEHVYTSVLLLKSVPVTKSGVMVTQNISNGSHRWLSVAINEGVGGAVDGQSAEQLLIARRSNAVRVLSHASAPYRRILLSGGGIKKILATGAQAILKQNEINQLKQIVNVQEKKFPMPKNDRGRVNAADIEFGFLKGKLALFQIRPFVQSKKAQKSYYLRKLDKELRARMKTRVNLKKIPSL
jgi:hypothetical protein